MSPPVPYVEFFLYFTFNRDFILKGFCCRLFLARHVIDEVHGRHFPEAMVQHTFCPNRIAQYIYRISPQEVAVVHPYSLSERSTGGHYPLCCYHGDCNRPQPQRWVMIAYTFRLCTTAAKVQKLLYTWFHHQYWNCAYLKVSNSLVFTLPVDLWLLKLRRDHQEKKQVGYP